MTDAPLPGSEETAKHLASTCLRDFEPAGPKPEFWRPIQFKVLPGEWPVPALVRYALLLVGLNDLGRREKTAFYMPFKFQGMTCAVSLEKFGMRVYVEHESAAEGPEIWQVRQSIVDKIASAVRVIESRILRPFSQQQVRLGNVTIVNQYRSLRHSYEYFREGARLAFAGEGRNPKSSPGGGLFIFADKTEGFYNLVAALNAYMSMLEHILVLSLPFIDFDPSAESLTDFIGKRWGEKYVRVLGKTGPQAAKHRESLVRLTETWRNTYSHGGFDKQHATMHFHTPGVGAIPAAFSDVRDSPHFQFVPAEFADFTEAMVLLDAVDAWLKSGPTSDAMEWIEAGLDVQFDQRFRNEMADAINTGKMVDLIEFHAQLWDRNANMDW